MNARITPHIWDGIERRTPGSCRRKIPDRRQSVERRGDPRNGTPPKRTLSGWLRMLTGGRVGVDRRKGLQRRMYDRRCNDLRSLLSREELDDLLR